jgi:hypothetical protein
VVVDFSPLLLAGLSGTALHILFRRVVHDLTLVGLNYFLLYAVCLLYNTLQHPAWHRTFCSIFIERPRQLRWFVSGACWSSIPWEIK